MNVFAPNRVRFVLFRVSVLNFSPTTLKPSFRVSVITLEDLEDSYDVVVTKTTVSTNLSTYLLTIHLFSPVVTKTQFFRESSPRLTLLQNPYGIVKIKRIYRQKCIPVLIMY